MDLMFQKKKKKKNATQTHRHKRRTKINITIKIAHSTNAILILIQFHRICQIQNKETGFNLMICIEHKFVQITQRSTKEQRNDNIIQ